MKFARLVHNRVFRLRQKKQRSHEQDAYFSLPMFEFIKRLNIQLLPGSDIAAIDLGSNSFHMIVGRPENDQILLVDQLREMVRMASGLDQRGYLDQQTMDNCMACLARFGQRVKHIQPHQLRIVGTNTLRKAKNAAQFLERAEQLLQHPIEIVSGLEEARLIYLGVAHSTGHESGRQLVVDIGGGSTEMIIGEKLTAVDMESLSIGCVSVTQEFFRDGFLTQDRFYQAHLSAMLKLEPHMERFKALGWQRAIGSSGTAKAIARVIREAQNGDGSITLAHMNNLIGAICMAGHIDKLQLTGLKDERVPIFAGGLVIMRAIFVALNIESMRISNNAMREGILFDLIGRVQVEDVREQTVKNLMTRYSVDLAQAKRVETQVLQLFDQVVVDWGLNTTDFRRILSWATRLHEIGISIAHSQYQKHGAYILQYADIMGFSWQEQRLLAFLVLAHRRGFPSTKLTYLYKPSQRSAKRLAILLRLAVLINRGRNPQVVVEPLLKVSKGNNIKLLFPKAWLVERPLTQSDLEQEKSYLRDVGYSLKFS